MHVRGSNSGVATLKKLADWGIPPQWITRIFADIDILTNPQVTKGYQSVLKECPPTVLVYPPKNIISDTGEIFYEKYSPDDSIEDDDDCDDNHDDNRDDMEVVLKKVKIVDYRLSSGISLTYIEKNNIQVQRGRPNEMANQWLYNRLEGRLLYLVETDQYYY